MLAAAQRETALGTTAAALQRLGDAAVAEGVAAARDVRLLDQLEADGAQVVVILVFERAADAVEDDGVLSLGRSRPLRRRRRGGAASAPS